MRTVLQEVKLDPSRLIRGAVRRARAPRTTLQGVRARHRPDPAAPRLNDWFLDSLGVDGSAVVARRDATLGAAGLAEVPSGSYHYTAFAALAESGFAPREILELGTFRAEATAFLASLFPSATVRTVDLPDDDPLITSGAVTPARGPERGARLDRPNIVALAANTMRLPFLGLPEPDLIWLDAGHRYPEVAWDHFWCLGNLAEGGWLLSDDIRLPENPVARDDPGTLQVHDVVDYWNRRSEHRFELLAKRPDPVLHAADPKYIGVLHRPAGGTWP
jgi:predicted O-methyltransferase YrrM